MTGSWAAARPVLVGGGVCTERRPTRGRWINQGVTMPKYVLTYHQPKGYVPRADADVIAAWQSFFEGLADHVVDPGQPVFERTSIGEVGADTQLGGYSIIEAADLEGAAALAKACPSVQSGGGVQ